MHIIASTRQARLFSLAPLIVATLSIGCLRSEEGSAISPRITMHGFDASLANEELDPNGICIRGELVVTNPHDCWIVIEAPTGKRATANASISCTASMPISIRVSIETRVNGNADIVGLGRRFDNGGVVGAVSLLVKNIGGEHVADHSLSLPVTAEEVAITIFIEGASVGDVIKLGQASLRIE